MPQQGAWARLLGTVFAHRVFDLVAVIALILYVLSTAHIPELGDDEPDRRRRRRGGALHVAVVSAHGTIASLGSRRGSAPCAR